MRPRAERFELRVARGELRGALADAEHLDALARSVEERASQAEEFGRVLLLGGYRSEAAGIRPLQQCEGLAGLLVSPSRGLLVYSPVLLLGAFGLGAVERGRRDIPWLLAAVAALGTVLCAPLKGIQSLLDASPRNMGWVMNFLMRLLAAFKAYVLILLVLALVAAYPAARVLYKLVAE